MNILYTIRDLHIGGTSNVLLQNVSLLSKEHKIHLVYFGKNATMVKRFEDFNVNPIYIEHTGFHNILATARRLRKYVKTNEIDVVHANLFLDKVVVFIATIGLKIKKIATIHAAIESKYGWTFKKKISNFFIFFLLNNFYNNITAVSKAAKIGAEKFGGLKSNKATVLYTGVKELTIPKNTINLFNIDTLILGTSCRFDPVKGLPRLLQTFRGLINLHPNIRLLLIGDGKERVHLEQQINELDLSEFVKITGFTSDVGQFINPIHFYVNSSFSEALGLGTIEAMSLSKPIIASNVGGLKEFIKSDYNGLLVDFQDIDLAVIKISKFLKNLDNYKVLSSNAKKTFDLKFNSDTYKQSLLDIYNS